MKGKLETNMAKLAFGDVDPQEALRLHGEAQSNPKAAQLLAEYEAMRKGLQALADVPDDQLSSDRLREAILREGLSPQPARNSGGWIWAPVAAACLGFVFLTLKPMQKAVPEVRIAKSDIPSLLPEAGPSLLTPTQSLAAMNTLPKKAAPVQAIAASNERPRHRIRRANLVEHKSTGDENPVLFDDYKPTGIRPQAASLGASSVAHPGGGMNSAPSPETDAAPATLVANAPIVMIDQEPDKATGAQRAVEVENSTNVVIGG